MREVPVYLFTGFLESGKTKFIQGFLEDERFNTKDNTLLLICEEGVEEYNTDNFKVDNVFIQYIDDESELTEEKLQAIQKKHNISRVVIEYNGMWSMNTLFDAMPYGWLIYQEMMFANANTFVSYNTNMRQLTVEKLQGTNLVILNRCTDDLDRMEIHKIVRGVTRSADIAYEFSEDRVEYDDIEDPLPFDIEADIIDINDEDYAIWYRDLSEEMEKYIGKTVRFKGIVAYDDSFPKNTIVVGRHVMVCCEDDITYRGLVCKGVVVSGLQKRDWIIVTAKITKEFHEMYEEEAPVLYATEIKRTSEPKQVVATFY